MPYKKESIAENKNSLTYPTRTLDPPFSIVDRAKEIQKADSIIEAHVNSRLDVILKQIRNLQEEAGKIIQQAEEDSKLHRIKCNFEKKPGMRIYLYERPDHDLYFSKLSPAEWSVSGYSYHGTYLIKPDLGFEKADN